MKKHFKPMLTINNAEHEFHFEKVREDDGPTQTVTVTEGDGRNTFSMGKDTDGQWKILTKGIPEWISSAELYLNEAILDHEGNDEGHNLLNPWGILGS